jgi:hypothetical protein
MKSSCMNNCFDCKVISEKFNAVHDQAIDRNKLAGVSKVADMSRITPADAFLVPKPRLGNASVLEAHASTRFTRSRGFSASAFPSWGLGTRKKAIRNLRNIKAAFTHPR